MSNVFDPKAFWQFATSLYAQDGVKDYCLSLQNEHAVDINLLLLCRWLDEQGYELPAEILNDLIGLSGHWQHSVLAPMRANRAVLKKGTKAHASTLEKELTMEAKEQQALIDLINLAEIRQEASLFFKSSNCLAYAAAAHFPINVQTPFFGAPGDD